MKTITALSMGALLAASASGIAYASPEEQLSGAVDIDCPDDCPMPSSEVVDAAAQCSPGFELQGTGSCVAPPDGYAAAALDEPDAALASNDGMDCLLEPSELVCSDEQEVCTQEYELALL